ncbi:hypothetical protein K3495_g1756 [Podosphaera aphanis]|nr:hypothetical protein K3495_g1756 [Podosphaera aphanis]
MAPTLNKSHDKDKRLRNIIALSSTLEVQLSEAVNKKEVGNLALDIKKCIMSFPVNSSLSSQHEDFEKSGIAIWNLCIRLRRDTESEDSGELHYLLFLARIFAFFLLDYVNQCLRAAPESLPRLIKIGIKAGKSCIDRNESDIALLVLSKVGGYQDLVTKLGTHMAKDDRTSSENLFAEYYILRTALVGVVFWLNETYDAYAVQAWQMEQFDIAEHMFRKSTSSGPSLDPNMAENLADVLYEMGRDLFNKRQYRMAVKWLNRAFEVINGQELDKLSKDASELRLSILQTLIKALLELREPKSFDEARNWLDMLEGEVGDRLVVLLLRLEIISTSNNDHFDSDAYSNTLLRIMRIVHLNESNFKLLMFHLRKLNDKSPSLACHAMDEIFHTRILTDDHEEYYERILITRIWMAVGYKDIDDGTLILQTFFSKLVAKIKKPISAAATLAAHTLLWKKIESNYAKTSYDIAEKWCRLATHPIFENSGEVNMARISRKLLLCALAKKEVGNAREIFASMTEAGKNEPLSRYLMYKVAIRCGDTEMAVECLHKISSATTKDPTLLYACCLDAQQMGNKPQLLVTLQLVIEKQNYGNPAGAHLPALLRLTIGLMKSMLDESEKSGATVDVVTIEKLCTTFESAASSIRRARGPSNATDTFWTVDEQEWFSKNSYNLAIKHLSDWNPRQTLRMLQSCIAIIDHYPPAISEQVSGNLQKRKLFCEFSATIILIALARAEDNIENQMQDYLNTRKHVSAFSVIFFDGLGRMDIQAQEDLNRKFSILVAFDFEATCRLKAWTDLGEIILKANRCKSSKVYEIMADCILCANAPTQVLVNTLKMIINEIWIIETLDIKKLARYMRCLFQITLSEQPEMTEQLLDQVCHHAQEASEGDQPYPLEELEWIATRTFNHAVDLYCCHDDNGCIRWSSKALQVAHYCDDKGALKNILQSKLVKLNLDV